jgi:thiol-disulfide isomerase/thioredoxin
VHRNRNFHATALVAAHALFVALLLPAGVALAVEAGEAAPGFSAKRLGAGADIDLAHYRGKVVYLDFWASWCPPYLLSLPALEKLRGEFPATDFEVLAVNLDRDPSRAMRFLAERTIGYPSATDPEGRIPEEFGLETMPTAYLIDREGIVRHVHKGFRKGDIDDLRGEIRTLVDGKRR